jgi:hypothetical protein
LVVVFNERRSIELDPAAARRSAGGILENHDPRGLSMRRYGVLFALVRGFFQRLRNIAAWRMALIRPVDGPLFGRLLSEAPGLEAESQSSLFKGLRRHFRVTVTLNLSVEVWAAHWRVA